MAFRLFNSIHKYVLKELTAAIISSVIAVNLLAYVISSLMLVRKFPVMGLSFFIESAPVMVYLFLPYTISLGVLIGITLTFGQLANEKEDVIMQFNGISQKIFIKPVILLTFLSFIAMFASLHFLQPIGFKSQYEQAFNVLKQTLRNMPSGSNSFNFKTFSIAYKDRITEKKGEKEEYWFSGLTVLFYKDGKVSQMISAEKGQLSFAMELNEIFFNLQDCQIIYYQKPYDKNPKLVHMNYFSMPRKFVDVNSTPVEKENKDSMDFRLTPENPDSKKKEIVNNNLQTPEFIYEIGVYKKETEKMEEELIQLKNRYWGLKEKINEKQKMKGNKEEVTESAEKIEDSSSMEIPIENPKTTIETENSVLSEDELKLLEIDKEITEKEKEIRSRNKRHARNIAELVRRFGMAFSMFSFVALGVPLGLLLKQSNKIVVFSLSLMIIAVVYYPVEQYCVKLVQQQKMFPLLIAILPNAVILFIAFILSRITFGK